MKRQKKVVGGNGPATATRRREKRKVEEEEPVAEKPVVVEERGDERENVAVAVAEEAEMSTDWDEGPRWRWSLVDEQMSWGSFWCPSWDIDYFGEAYDDALYSDVVWDYDIWDLRGINEIGSGKCRVTAAKKEYNSILERPGALVSVSESSKSVLDSPNSSMEELNSCMEKFGPSIVELDSLDALTRGAHQH